jgi:hypothetical protein
VEACRGAAATAGAAASWRETVTLERDTLRDGGEDMGILQG